MKNAYCFNESNKADDTYTIKKIKTRQRLGLFIPINSESGYHLIVTNAEMFGIHKDEPEKIVLMNKNFNSQFKYKYIGPITKIDIFTE